MSLGLELRPNRRQESRRSSRRSQGFPRQWYPGYRKDQDSSRLAVPLEDLGNLVGGGARGQDVVHQHQIGSGDSPRLPEPEGVAHVPPASLQVESELGQGRTRPAKAREQRKVQSSAQGSSQQESLVESPFSPAPRMGRNRYQPGRGKWIGPRPVGFLEQGRQRMRQAAVAGEFEAMDQLPQGSGVRSPGPSRVMEGPRPPARHAGSRSLWIFLPIRNRQITGGRRPATNGAERILEPGQLQEAFGTKGTGIRIGDPAAA